jgi:hypothetical protein
MSVPATKDKASHIIKLGTKCRWALAGVNEAEYAQRVLLSDRAGAENK